MIRKTDKYLLLFILMIVLSLQLNAESLKLFQKIKLKERFANSKEKRNNDKRKGK